MSAPRKNILLISFDDAVSFWHYKRVFGAELQTPNLDRICAQSTAFHAAYCQSPLCGPSRSSFMSGKSPPETGIYSNRQSVFDHVRPQDMWPYLLKDAGYFCSSGGKVHHGFKPLAPEVHEVLYSDARKRFRIDIKLRPKYAQTRSGGNGGGISTTDTKDDGYYHDAHSAKSFTEFLDGYDGTAPFYREVGFFSPHSPFITPLRYKQMYPLGTLRAPPAWRDPFERSDYAKQNIIRNFRTHKTRHWQKSVRNYFAALSHGDHHLGTVWDALKASPHAQNTIVVIVSDHGFHLGEGNRFGKSTLWEQSAAVPLIIHDPDQPDPRAITAPVAMLDLGPTVLDFAGLPGLPGCAGRSLKPVVDGSPPDDTRAVPTFNRHGASIRKGQYRFIRYINGDTELYDLEQDWWQQNRLGPDHPAYTKMQNAHAACCAEHGLTLQ